MVLVSRAALRPLLLCLVLAPFAASAAVQVAGSDGRTLSLAAPARRIVALAPDLVEMVYDVDAGAALVGAVEYSDYPETAKNLPRVGDAFRVDLERLVALKPDLVLAWRGGTPQALVERLRALNLPVLSLGTRELDDIGANLETLGTVTGHEDSAKRAAQFFRARLVQLHDRYAGTTPIRVFYEIQSEPIFTVGRDQSISRLIALCGGQNIFADLTELAPVVSLESVIARDPQAIVTGTGEGDAGGRLKEWQRWPQLAAVHAGNLFPVNGDLISRSTPRLLDAGQELCEDLDLARSRLAAH
jgi:iron complex transport system substrate-binding protein